MLKTSIGHALDIFKHLQKQKLGDTITVLKGVTPTEVVLVRMGRQNIRVRDKEGLKFLVDLRDVVVPSF